MQPTEDYPDVVLNNDLDLFVLIEVREAVLLNELPVDALHNEHLFASRSYVMMSLLFFYMLNGAALAEGVNEAYH